MPTTRDSGFTKTSLIAASWTVIFVAAAFGIGRDNAFVCGYEMRLSVEDVTPEIRMRFAPASFRNGAVVSVASLALLGLALARTRRGR
ncbi:MAG: hypothetical protein FJ197_04480 [Gammaproteobacteria bacterium]|nr:hypothetical protein [Gammaproteobacteria bacterium]